MAVEVEIVAEPNLDKLLKWATEIEKEVLTDVSVCWTDVIRFVTRTLDRRFKTENRGRWAALSPQYKAWKERKYPGRPILQLTQRLYHAATKKGAKGNICEEEKTRLTWGVDEEVFLWAGYVQSGVKAPSRIWCGLEKSEAEDVNLIFGHWLRKGLERKSGQVR